ncbi:thiamine ABC transporter substrate-binding protein [Leucobacter ruminantium]|uniref:Thiamine ABC transporter substrate-binding protein n=1 Tax=Leucobacter ruminantium TaxID=1289170 RepID=A0A939LT15_9MICO|nr:thiamine ABC transporter substrate-binding protein [Leucobacter ruminantium]MBO1804199.1 thiamine ABC transporter substrate-binding protein [Leucobacter ruminantium]
MMPARPSSLAIRRAVPVAVVAAAALGLALTGCSGSPDEADSRKVTLVVHDAFPNEEFAKAASAATGYDVEVITGGEGGELTNKLVLTRGAPIADAFYGVDNTYASRLIENDVVEPYTPEGLPASADEYAFDGSGSLTPVDVGATCINIDTEWFAEHGIAEPSSYEDLARPEYRDLSVLLDPLSSSTGGSFLIGTVAEFGEDGYLDYWQRLLDNGARLEQNWSDAYYGQFSAASDGDRPIVLSYSSSPVATLNDDGTASSSRALLDTCTSEVEYAGVLAGAANAEGARAVVDYLVSSEFQATIPDTMYMYPVDADAGLPETWAEFAPMPSREQLRDLPASEVDAGREGWLKRLGEQIGL